MMIRVFSILICFVLMNIAPWVSAKSNSLRYNIGEVEGIWQLYDQIKQTRTIQVKLSYEAYTNTFVGNILQIDAATGLNNKAKCVKCPKTFKNKPIKNLKSIWGLKPEINKHGKFTGNYKGHILNPFDGQISTLIITGTNSSNIIRAKTYRKGSQFGVRSTWKRIQ